MVHDTAIQRDLIGPHQAYFDGFFSAAGALFREMEPCIGNDIRIKEIKWQGGALPTASALKALDFQVENLSRLEFDLALACGFAIGLPSLEVEAMHKNGSIDTDLIHEPLRRVAVQMSVEFACYLESNVLDRNAQLQFWRISLKRYQAFGSVMDVGYQTYCHQEYLIFDGESALLLFIAHED